MSKCSGPCFSEPEALRFGLQLAQLRGSTATESLTQENKNDYAHRTLDLNSGSSR
jgi:hypothetical protein